MPADGRRPPARLQQFVDHFFQFFLVDRKLTDTFRQFVYRHRILVMLPQELRFRWPRSGRAFTSPVYHQLTLNSAFAFGQLFQQRRGDGQAVTASQFQNFANVTEALRPSRRFHSRAACNTRRFLLDGNHARDLLPVRYSFLSVLALYQSRIRPTNGEIRKTPASAQARA